MPNPGVQVIPGGDHLLIPTGTQQNYAQIRVLGTGRSKIRLGSLR